MSGQWPKQCKMSCWALTEVIHITDLHCGRRASFSVLVCVVLSGESINDIVQAENERLTEERNELQLNIRQLEQRLNALQSHSTHDVVADLVSVQSPFNLFLRHFSITTHKCCLLNLRRQSRPNLKTNYHFKLP